MAEWLQAAINDVGMLLAALVTFWVLLRKSRDQIQERIESAKREHIEHTQSAVTRVNGALEKMMRQLPYPAWIKLALPKSDGGWEFRMQYINPSYEARMGVPLLDYVGKTDFDVWPHEVASAYFANDMKAMSGPTAIRFREPVSQPLFGADGQPGEVGAVYEFEKVRIEQYDMVAIVGFMRDTEGLAHG